ncbi:hypothetical protein [Sorangium sp. So ce1335]|uniref:hypothetical protein n=1 Tax=Sorangium sp. So ce1335 TaxID=3133335 RepID=UPI003F640614
MRRPVHLLVPVALAAAHAAGPPGCHRERSPQGDAATGALGPPASAPAASAAAPGTAAAGAGDLNGLQAVSPGAAGAPLVGSPPPAANAGAALLAPGTGASPGAPAGGPFEKDAWLAAHGAAWRPDTSCWSTLATSPPRRLNVCSCRGAIRLPEVELMVCSHAREPESGGAPAVTHTVLYAARGGAIRAVLDVPTGAMLDDCAPGAPVPCRVALDLRAEGDAIRFEEAAGATLACDHPWIAASTPLPGASDWNSASGQRVRATYRRVCGARGRYVWQGDALRPSSARTGR